MSKYQRQLGDFVRIDLGDSSYAFARVLKEPLMAFYDLNVTEQSSIEEIRNAPVAFKIWVMNAAITSGRWQVIGNVPLCTSMLEPVRFFKRDRISGALSIYEEGEEYSATEAACDGLEKAAVWSAEHVEDRLRDFFAGKPNKWLEALRSN